MDTKKWMAQLPDSTPLCSISLPGTHDSTTRYVDWSAIARCQSLSVSQQLELGFRMFDIRLKLEDGAFNCVHGISFCRKGRGRRAAALSFDEVYADCAGFLNENPSETVLLFIMADAGERGVPFFREFYKKYVKDNPVWYTENRVPLLSECRSRIVLINRCAGDAQAFDDSSFGINFSHWPYQGKASLPSVMGFDAALLSGNGIAASIEVQDKYTLRHTAKWRDAALVMFEQTHNDGKVYINCLSTAGELNPRYSSRKIIPAATEYLKKRRSFCGWVMSDFACREFSESVIACNFTEEKC
ncbi:MAG: hypothetical protein GX051_03345 [Clostridiales bacterium]|nr:hypothetical protein [Clostridiales bacterium]